MVVSPLKPIAKTLDRLKALDERAKRQGRHIKRLQRRNAEMARRFHLQAKRLSALEAEVQEERALGVRVAELSDMVQELLLPAAARDEQKLRELLDKYARSL